MDVPSGFRAALQRAQRPAVVVTDAAFVGIAAVGDAVVGMPSGNGAALYLADRDGGGTGGKGRTDRGPPVTAAAVTAVGGNGERQQRQGQDAEKQFFEFHGRDLLKTDILLIG